VGSTVQATLTQAQNGVPVLSALVQYHLLTAAAAMEAGFLSHDGFDDVVIEVWQRLGAISREASN
jgi:hypothetical protein